MQRHIFMKLNKALI